MSLVGDASPEGELRTLSPVDLGSAEFRQLLWLAVEVDDGALGRVIEDDLPQLCVIGVVLDGVVVGFVAFRAPDPVLVIDYIATATAQHGTGLGRRLIRELQRRNPRASIIAQTDDDAIGFYRRLGFISSPAPRDPRWPERQRYDCVLAPIYRCASPSS